MGIGRGARTIALALAMLACWMLPSCAAARAGTAHRAASGLGRFYTGGPAELEPVEYPAGVERLHYRYGPLTVRPGTNLILLGNKPLPKPHEDGFVVGIVPNLTLPDGKVPPTDILHLHHGVWLSTKGPDPTSNEIPLERFFATGEEKTQLHLPMPYGYPVAASDTWILNYMIHNLTAREYTVYITYEIDWVPVHSPLGESMHPVRPLWMDVRNGEAYPVFDALRGKGSGGTYTYPDQEPAAYPHEGQRDEWTVEEPGTLVWAGGHLHPGGLYDTLELIRPGASIASAPPGGAGPVAGAEPHSVQIFRSSAHYWDTRGPISWDLAMSVTKPSWRVAVQPGDVLRISTTYDSARASWYEAMGIMVVWMAEDSTGVNPFDQAVDTTGFITHPRLRENVDSGGVMSLHLPNPARLPNGHAPHNTIDIRNFTYLYGGYGLGGNRGDPPAIHQGESLDFINQDNRRHIYHTVTSCVAPCMLNGGISYPLANGPAGFDSASLGTGVPGFTAASQHISWHTPHGLAPGTYTYFCRIHPWMRGAFRVIAR